MEQSPAYWAFLSYSSLDRPYAVWLQRSLENYVLPRRFIGRATPAGPPAPRRFSPIFRDRAELPAHPDLLATISRALESSAYLIVLCSQQSAKSQWVDEEIVRFRALHGNARILTVILDGSPQDEQHGCFPPALRYRRESTTIGERIEPIAADLRPRGDGRRMARLKLLAGMLGVGLDELVRRDAQRRQRVMAGVSVASLAGLVIAGALATAAWIARNDAQKQRAHAEGLIEFMLSDLRKELEPSGRLDAMDGVAREALSYYRAQRPAQLDDQSLARRARALRLMGEVSLQRGELRGALDNFTQASATTAELLARSPASAQDIFNHAQNVFWVGEIARQRGDFAQAEASFRQYFAFAQQLIDIDAQNSDWQAEVGYAQSALGTLFVQEGKASAASEAFERSLAIALRLAARKPADLSLQLEVGQGHAWLADALQQQGRMADARVHCEAELKIYREVLTKDPTLRQAKFATVDALQTLASLAMIAGDADSATRELAEAIRRAEALLESEPSNMNLKSVVAVAQVAYGEALIASAGTELADAAQKRAEALISDVLKHDDSVELWQEYRDRGTLLQAAISARRGQIQEALDLDHAVLSRLKIRSQSKANTPSYWLLERSRLQLGDHLATTGAVREANEQWAAIVTSLPGPLESYEPRLLLVLAAAQSRRGNLTAAQAIDEKLRILSLSRDPSSTP